MGCMAPSAENPYRPTLRPLYTLRFSAKVYSPGLPREKVPAGAIALVAWRVSRRGYRPHSQDEVPPGPLPTRPGSGHAGAIARTAMKRLRWGHRPHG